MKYYIRQNKNFVQLGVECDIIYGKELYYT